MIAKQRAICVASLYMYDPATQSSRCDSNHSNLHQLVVVYVVLTDYVFGSSSPTDVILNTKHTETCQPCRSRSNHNMMTCTEDDGFSSRDWRVIYDYIQCYGIVLL